MDPEGSRQKGHEGSPEQIGLLVDNWPLTTRVRVTFDIQRVYQTFNGGRDEHLSKLRKRAEQIR